MGMYPLYRYLGPFGQGFYNCCIGAFKYVFFQGSIRLSIKGLISIASILKSMIHEEFQH